MPLDTNKTHIDRVTFHDLVSLSSLNFGDLWCIGIGCLRLLKTKEETQVRLLKRKKMAAQQPTTAPITAWRKFQIKIRSVARRCTVSRNLDYNRTLRGNSQLLALALQGETHSKVMMTYSFIRLNHFRNL